MLTRKTSLLIAVALMATSSAVANELFSVLVTTQCKADPVGERIGFKVREGIRKSSSMKTVDSYSDSVVQMSIVCMDPGSEQVGSISRYSYAITTSNPDGHYDFQIMHGVASCGTKRVDECAEGLVADIDSAISDAMKRVNNGTFRYKKAE